MGDDLTGEDLRRRRTEFLRPLMVRLEERGAPQSWLARQVGTSPRMLWRYLHGLDRVPPQVLADACRVLKVPRSHLPLTAPAEALIQQPHGIGTRAARTSAPSRAASARSPPARGA